MNKSYACLLLLIVLPACTLDQSNRERLRLLSIEACAERLCRKFYAVTG